MKRVLLIVCILFASPVYALTGISFGVKGGIGTSADFAGIDIQGQEFDRLTMIGGQIKVSTLPMIDVIGTVEYGWKTLKGVQVSFGGTDYSVEYRIRDLALTASLVYPLKMQIIKPYAGLGIGNHNLGYEITANGLPTGLIPPDDKSYFGYHIIGGIDLSFPAFPLSLTGEFRYNWINTPDETTKYMQLTAGVNFSFL